MMFYASALFSKIWSYFINYHVANLKTTQISDEISMKNSHQVRLQASFCKRKKSESYKLRYKKSFANWKQMAQSVIMVKIDRCKTSHRMVGHMATLLTNIVNSLILV